VSGTPAFSAVIPLRDGLPDVLEAVASALGQSCPPDEVILVDDGSTDGGADAVERRFGAGTEATRLTVLRGRFGGAAAARNAGWRVATRPWVALLDADDLWFRDKLETAARTLSAATEAAWFFSDGAFRTIDGVTRASWFEDYADVHEPYVGQPVAELLEVNFILTSSVVVRRDALEQLGGFDPSLSHAEDLDLWIRLARRWPATASRRALVRYQHRAGGLTRQIETRLMGDVTLFHRLASDPELDPRWRTLARAREARCRFRLAMTALRDGRRAQARVHLREAWRFPDRALPVCSAWVASLVPAGWLARLRGRRWATQVAAPMGRARRVVLRGTPLPAAVGRRT